MRLLFSETTIAICSVRQAQSFVQSRQEKVFTPHDALIDTEFFALVINSVFKDAFPTRGFVGQELWAEQRVENYESVLSITVGL